VDGSLAGDAADRIVADDEAACLYGKAEKT
jgi:hypothetical protein